MNQRPASKHVDELCKEMGVKVRRLVPQRGRARAYGGPRYILVRGLNQDTEYFTALHELGHIALGDAGESMPRNRLLEEEANAWAWALKTAKWPASAIVKRMIGTKLQSYLDHSSGKASKSPPAGHVFYEMIDWQYKYAKPARKKARVLP